jgi:hypothetical protein
MLAGSVHEYRIMVACLECLSLANSIEFTALIQTVPATQFAKKLSQYDH